jgi:hypothetical protein
MDQIYSTHRKKEIQMNITLRKANALQNSILEAIRGIKIETQIEISEFQDAEAVLMAANQTLFTNDARRQQLLMAHYNIRGLVGAANAQSGIDLALTKAAFVDKRIAQLTELADGKTRIDAAIIAGKLDKIRNRKEESRASLYGRDDTVSTPVMIVEQLASVTDEIKNLKKQKQKLNDEVLELNIKTEIPLSDETAKLLQVEGLL